MGTTDLAFAISLGQLRLYSALDQPLKAEISIDDDEELVASDIHVRIASADEYKHLKIEPSAIVSKLNFAIVIKQKNPQKLAIKVTSDQVITDPFIALLIEVTWPRGEIVRSYTILLDPPDNVGPEYRASASSREPKVLKEADLFVKPRFIPKRYGATTASDELYRIAHKVRPSADVTIDQVMIAILKANPDAFSENNINQLKTGEVLTIPTQEQMQAISAREAEAAVLAQNNAWHGGAPSAVAARTPTPVKEEVASAGKTPLLSRASKSPTGESASALPLSSKPAGQASSPASPPQASTEIAAVPPPPGTENTAPAKETNPQLATLTPAQTLTSRLESNATTPGKEELMLTEKERHLRTEAVLTAEAYRAATQENQALKSHLAALEQKITELQKQVVHKDEMLLEMQKETDQTGKYSSTAGASVTPNAPPAQAITPAPAKAETAPVHDKTKTTTVTRHKPMSQAYATRQQEQTSSLLIRLLLIFMPLMLLIGGGLWGFRQYRKRIAPRNMEVELMMAAASAAANTTAAPVQAPVSQPTASSPAPAVSKMDPVEEAKVYMAYGRYDQAQAVLLTAIEQQPLRLELMIKLIETYDAEQNTNEVLIWLKRLPIDLATRAPEYLNKIEQLRQKYHLAAAPAPTPASAAPASTSPTAPESRPQTAPTITVTVTKPTTSPAAEAKPIKSTASEALESSMSTHQESTVELEFTQESLPEPKPVAITKPDSAAQTHDGLEFDPNALQEFTAKSSNKTEPVSVAPADHGNALEFTTTVVSENKPAAAPAVVAPVVEETAEQNNDFSFDSVEENSEVGVNVFSLEEEKHSTQETALPKPAAATSARGSDIVDLALAYIDIGDIDGARELLNEAIKVGDESVRQKVQEILERINR